MMNDFHTYAVDLMRSLGLAPDPWQLTVLETHHPRLLLNCARQAGKSTTVAVLALAQALYVPGTQVLIVSRSFRQAHLLFMRVVAFHRRLRSPLHSGKNAEELSFSNGSRIVCVPCKEETIRGYSGIDLILIDEAARVPDDIYRAVRPMLAVSRGRLICLSTPWGKRGFFWEAWTRGGDDWQRIEVPAALIPRLLPDVLATEHRALGDAVFRREYCCSFEALEGLVFPDLPRCVTISLASPLTPTPLPHGERGRGEGGEGSGVSGTDRWVGGIDFGYRNPFAAILGYLTRDHVLVLTGEHYCREKPLSHHARYLPKNVTWYADPSGATERSELRRAGFTVRGAKNALEAGIAAVNARIQSGMLLIKEAACPNLIAEAGLYRYDDEPKERRAEVPIDEHNHALSALRYLIMMIDAHHLAGRPAVPAPEPAKPEAAKLEPWWVRFEKYPWTPISPRD